MDHYPQQGIRPDHDFHASRATDGKLFAKLTQYGPECEGYLPVGVWQAFVVGAGQGGPNAEGKTAAEAWAALEREVGPVAPHDAETAGLLSIPAYTGGLPEKD